MSSPQSTPLRKGKRKSAPLDVEVASATKKSRTSLQSAAISDSAVNGNAVSGRKRKSVGKAGAIDEEKSENASTTGRGKKRQTSSSEAIDPALHESSSSSSVFQNAAMSASKTRNSLPRSSSVSELAPAASTPRKAVRRASTSTPAQDATPSRGRGRASRLQPITEAVPNVSLPVIPLDILTGSSGHVSAPPTHVAPIAVTAAPAPAATLATAPLASARIVLNDTWYSWLSALIIIALVTSSMLSNLGILPSPSQILPITTFSSSSMHTNNSSMLQTHVTDHFDAGQTIAAVEILNQSITGTAYEISALVAEIIATRSEQELKKVDVVIKEVDITQDDEHLAVEEALSEVESMNSAQHASVVEVATALIVIPTEPIEDVSNDIVPESITPEQVQAAVEAVSESTKETNNEAQVVIEGSQAAQEELVDIQPELEVVVIEEEVLPETSDANIDALDTDLDNIAAQQKQEEEKEDDIPTEKATVKEGETEKQVAETVTSVLHTAGNHVWPRTTHHDHHPILVEPSKNNMLEFTWEHDLVLSARGTTIDGSHLSLIPSPTNKKENALLRVTKFIMQPLRKLTMQRLLDRLNSYKPVKDMSSGCVYFNHQAANAVVVKLLMMANVSSIALTHLLPNITAEGEQVCSGVKDFTVHNQATIAQPLSFGNRVGEFTASFDDINNARILASKTEVAGGILIKQIFRLPKATQMKSIGFSLNSLQDETASIGCLCRVHVYGEFVKELRRGEEEEEQQQLLM